MKCCSVEDLEFSPVVISADLMAAGDQFAWKDLTYAAAAAT